MLWVPTDLFLLGTRRTWNNTQRKDDISTHREPKNATQNVSEFLVRRSRHRVATTNRFGRVCMYRPILNCLMLPRSAEKCKKQRKDDFSEWKPKVYLCVGIVDNSGHLFLLFIFYIVRSLNEGNIKEEKKEVW